MSLKAARIESGLSQTEIGEKLGVSKSTISRWEKGEILPTQDQIDSFCKACNIAKKHIKLKKQIM